MSKSEERHNKLRRSSHESPLLAGLVHAVFPHAKLVEVSVLRPTSLSPRFTTHSRDGSISNNIKQSNKLPLGPSLHPLSVITEKFLMRMASSSFPPLYVGEEEDADVKVLTLSENSTDSYFHSPARDEITTNPSQTFHDGLQNVPKLYKSPSSVAANRPQISSSSNSPQYVADFNSSQILLGSTESQDLLDSFPNPKEFENSHTPRPSSFYDDDTKFYPIVTTIKTEMRIENLERFDPDQITTTLTYHTNSLSTVTRTATVIAHFIDDLDIHKDISWNFGEDQETSMGIPSTEYPTKENMIEGMYSSSIQTFSATQLPLDKLYTEDTITQLSLQDLDTTNFTPEITVSITSEFSIDKTIPISNIPKKVSSRLTTGSKTEKNNTALFSTVFDNSKLNSSIGTRERIDHSSAILLSAVTSCILILVIFTIISLWVLRRNKNHSKVYLNYELSKHKNYVTRPMQPGILSSEIMPDALRVLKHKPRPPVLLIQEMETLPPVSIRPKISTSESCDSGIDNLAYIDASSDGQSTASIITKSTDNIARKFRPVPKYTARIHRKRMQNASVLTRVCSSDGGIFPTSPSLSKCFVPPPPYSPNIQDKDFNLSLNLSATHTKNCQITYSGNSDTTSTSDGSPSDNIDEKIVDTIIDLT